MIQLAINSRYSRRCITGVERFATEVVKRLPVESDVSLRELAPSKKLEGIRGHLWEQSSLALRVRRDEILFSPCNTGPVAVKNQLVVIHDAAIWDCPDGFTNSFRRLYEALLPALSKRAEAIATVSTFSRSRLAMHLGMEEERIAVLGNAASEIFVPSPETKTDRPLTLLCAGSLDLRKNFSTLIEAWVLLRKQSRLPEDARLEIVGASGKTRFAHLELEDAPGLHWLGRVSDEELVKRYQQADGFLFPSLYEGFGIPPIEAMACGCPALLSNRASLPEVGGEEFRPSEGNSTGAVFYFDPESPAEIAGVIEKFLSLAPVSREAMGRNALERAAHFTWSEVARRTSRALLF